MGESAESDWPMFLYIHDTDGRHSGSIKLKDESEFKESSSFIREAIAAGREVRITDSLDFLVFHARDGEVLWPNETNTPPDV